MNPNITPSGQYPPPVIYHLPTGPLMAQGPVIRPNLLPTRVGKMA